MTPIKTLQAIIKEMESERKLYVANLGCVHTIELRKINE